MDPQPESVMVCDLSRAADKTRPVVLKLDEVPTLVTSCRHFWVVGVSDALPKCDRFLTTGEKAILHGFSSDLALRLRPGSAPRILGNAMSVPAIGVVLAAVFADFKGE